MRVRLFILAAYLVLIFAWGIHHTQRTLIADVTTRTADTGRVNLLCSYGCLAAGEAIYDAIKEG